MTEGWDAARIAAQDQTDARFADVTAQVQRRMDVQGTTATKIDVGPLEERVMDLWDAYLASDAVKQCMHPTDRYYWIISELALGCELCWGFWRETAGVLRCWSHTCDICGRHQQSGIEYRQHAVAFAGEVGEDAEELPVIIIPFIVCAECEKQDNVTV